MNTANLAFHSLQQVADSWSCEYEFEELEIEIDGISVGSFSGTAELAVDPGYTFYVKAISLNGSQYERQPGSFFRRPVSKKVHLARPAGVPSTLSEHLFVAIAAALDCEDAREFFLSEREAA